MRIYGQLDWSERPRIQITVEAPTGVTRTYDALVDTGFNGELVLPLGEIKALNLPFFGVTEKVTFADGNERQNVPSFEAKVSCGGSWLWFGYVYEFGTKAIVGMQYLLRPRVSDCVQLSMSTHRASVGAAMGSLVIDYAPIQPPEYLLPDPVSGS
jgi:hypothetical protein